MYMFGVLSLNPEGTIFSAPTQSGRADLAGTLLENLWSFNIADKLREAEVLIGRWRTHYNTKRPHSSLGYRLPAPQTIAPEACSARRWHCRFGENV
jgi:putative transposase